MFGDSFFGVQWFGASFWGGISGGGGPGPGPDPIVVPPIKRRRGICAIIRRWRI